MPGIKREYSAGGVVVKNRKVLLVRIKATGNPLRGTATSALLKKGDYVWTFPKGHVERGETPRRAALREVREETGWECRVRRTLELARYSFTRRGRKVSKRVRWYLMDPISKTGRPDAGEIFGAGWLSFSQARARLKYPADFRLLAKAGK
ncbi:MAG: NUDIX domain-containing protein [Elusimicrobiota bacterium]